MNLENPQSPLPPHHVHLSLKVVMLIFALVLVGTLGFFIYDAQKAADDQDYSSPKVKKTETATETKTEAAVADNAVACGDKAYAFELTFASALWDKRVIKEYKPANNEAIIYCYVTVPTTDTDAVWTTAAQDHDAKYASVFAIGVYTPAQWAAADDPNLGPELGKNANYVWNYGSAQALPTDLQANKIAADVKNVVATFKIAK